MARRQPDAIFGVSTIRYARVRIQMINNSTVERTETYQVRGDRADEVPAFVRKALLEEYGGQDGVRRSKIKIRKASK